MSSAVLQWPLTLGVLVLLAAAYPVLGLRTGTSGVETLPDSTFAKSGATALEQNFPARRRPTLPR